MNRFILFGVMCLWFGFANAADSLYGGFSAQSPPGPVGQGTVWSIWFELFVDGFEDF